MINLELPKRDFEYQDDVPDSIKNTLEQNEDKFREVSFAYKLLLLVMIPWLWLCFMSYLMVIYYNEKKETEAKNDKDETRSKVISVVSPLANNGNVHALIYLAAYGDMNQKIQAQNKLANFDSIEANYFNAVQIKQTTDIPDYNLNEDQAYVRDIITYAHSGYPRALNDLILIEKELTEKGSRTESEIKSLHMIHAFKSSISQN